MNNLERLAAAAAADPSRASRYIRAAYWLGAAQGVELAKQDKQARTFALDNAQLHAGTLKIDRLK